MKTKLKKSISLVLSLLMLVTCFSVGFCGLTMVAEAQTGTNARPVTTENEDVQLIVPEQIYAAPDAQSWRPALSVHTPFQLFVNTNADGSITKGAKPDDQGEFYFRYSYATNVTVNVSAYLNVNQLGNPAAALTTGYVTFAGQNNTRLDNVNITNDEHFTFTGMTPDLAAATQGYYLLWKVSYLDTKDNTLKAAYSVTYVYKPYVLPIAAGARAVGGNANKCNAGMVTFMTGFHAVGLAETMGQATSITHTGTDYKKYSGNDHQLGFLQYAGNYGFSAFMTDKTMYSNSVPQTSTQYGFNTDYLMMTNQTHVAYGEAYNDYSIIGETDDAKRQRYQYVGIPFASTSGTSSGTAGFLVPNDKDFGYYTSTDRNNADNFTNPVDNNQLWYLGEYYSKADDSWTGSCLPLANAFAPVNGVMSVDTSRYDKLEQIPNLNVGMMVTTNQGAGGDNPHWYSAQWYIADASVAGGTPGGTTRCVDFDNNAWCENPALSWTYSGSFDDEKKAYNRMYYGYSEIIAGQTSGNNLTQSYDSTEGVRYAGKWRTTANLKNNTSTYSTEKYLVKGFYQNNRSGNNNYGAAAGSCQLKVYQVNKSGLRTQVNRARKAMALLGVNNILNGNLESGYFLANTDYKWDDLQSAYRTAIDLLTRVNLSEAETQSITTATNNLRTALNNLQTRVTFGNSAHGQFSHADMYVRVGTDGQADVDLTGFDSSVTVDTGYEFKGFSTDINATTATANTATVGYNQKIYPVCTPIHITVTLDPDNGGLYHPGQVDFEAVYGTRPANIIDTPLNQGCTFKGYFTQRDGLGVQVFDEDGKALRPWNFTGAETTTVLYASWERKPCNVIFRDKDGEVYDTQTVLFGQKAVDNHATYTKAYNDRYHFAFKEFRENGKLTDLTVNNTNTVFEVVWTQEAHGNWVKDDSRSWDASCGSEGQLTEKCGGCNYVRVTVVPRNDNHVPGTPQKENVYTEDTCDHGAGYDLVTRCQNCNEILDSQHFGNDPLGHDFTKQEPTPANLKSAATCVHGSEYYYVCSRCGKSSKGTDHEATYTMNDKAQHRFVKVVCDKSFNDADFECYLCTVCGYAYTSNGLTMQVTNNETTITGYTGNENKIYIPEHVNGSPFVAVADNVFRGYSDIEHVFYGGTEEEWNKIDHDRKRDALGNTIDGNDPLFAGPKLHFSGGTGTFDENSYKGCPYCGKIHPTTFMGKLTQFFHVILNFFRKMSSALQPHK